MKDSLNEITSKRRNEIGEASTRVLNDRITESLRNNRFFNESKWVKNVRSGDYRSKGHNIVKELQNDTSLIVNLIG